jgi:hypothetical protein
MAATLVEAVGLRVVADLEIPCPAGEPIGETNQGSGCLCRVEGERILAATNPSSLGRFCTSVEGFKRCPTWQREKAKRGVATLREVFSVEEAAFWREQEAEEERRRELREAGLMADTRLRIMLPHPEGGGYWTRE